ncbi:hypothetical protein J437_LFUL008054 [Ladona fulva]|uniref:Amidase domain-containing protein n=1 Tax=Ladona fulva TaxID=123851 RepID=A0A8K0K2K9_LADFU|nr:hypothetical protein J437_LFUL008054 [Ladona fulva]
MSVRVNSSLCKIFQAETPMGTKSWWLAVLRFIILNLVITVHQVVDAVIDKLFSIYYKGCKKQVPPVKSKLLLYSALDLAREIKNKSVKSEEVVQAYIDRIIEINPILNSVVDNRFDAALEEARKVDEALQNGSYTSEQLENMPFLGVPFSTKVSTCVKGNKAALVSACGSPIGIGTDIGGSLRMPAFFCGLTPLKGLNRRTGQETRTMVAAGPMCCHSKDLLPSLRVLVGLNQNLLKLGSEVNPKRLKYYFMMDDSRSDDGLGGDLRLSSVDDSLRICMLRVVSHLKEENAFVKQVHLTGMRYGFPLWRYWMTQEPEKFSRELANGEGEINLWTELPKKLLNMSDFSLPAIMRLADEKLPPINEKWARETTIKLQNDISKLLGDDGILLYPSHPFPAFYRNSSLLRPYNFAYTAVLNVLNLPVTQVPMGLNKDGVPLGLQVVATYLNDHLTIGVARYLEESNSWASSNKRHTQGKVHLTGMRYGFPLWRYWMTQEPEKFSRELANGEGEINLWTELPKKLLNMSDFSLPAIMRLADEKLPPINEKWARETTIKLQNDISKLLGDDGILLYPSHPFPAFYRNSSLLRPYNFAYTAVLNVLNLPVTQVPMGLNKDGVPLGLQVVATSLNDHLTIGVARYLEEVFGGWVPPTQRS